MKPKEQMKRSSTNRDGKSEYHRPRDLSRSHPHLKNMVVVASKTLALNVNEFPGLKKGCRIAEALAFVFPERYETSTSCKKSIRRGEVFVDGEKCDVGFCLPKTEDTLRIDIYARVNGKSFSPSSADTIPEDMQPGAGNGVKVVYEDAECAVVLKPFGIPTLKQKNISWTLDRLLQHVMEPAKSVEGALHRPRPVHRLDKNTGGLVVCAKTRRACNKLSEAFRERTAKKKYRAVLVRYKDSEKLENVPKKGTIKSNDMGESGDLYAETEYEIVESNGSKRFLVDFFPKTGRTHQLRKHAAAQLKMPILGDNRYGGKFHRNEAKKNCMRLHLFATEIKLPLEATPWAEEAVEVAVLEPIFFRSALLL